MVPDKLILDASTIAKAEYELKQIKDHRLSIQLKAIIACGEHAVGEVAEILQCSVRSVFRWIHKFRDGGIDGLRDKPKGHMRSKLTEESKASILKWVEQGKNAGGESVNWTLDKLRKELEDVFDISIGITSLWKQLKKMDLVLRRPRPIHCKTDKQVQEEFKKNLKK